jgi:flagellar basal body P-ring formation protein FlgA
MSWGPMQKLLGFAWGSLRAPSFLAAVVLLQHAALPAFAEDRTVPTPTQVIYPGDVIRDSMLTDLSVYDIPNAGEAIIESRAALVGRIAKRTLLPGRGIAALGVGNPNAVANGAQVKLIYRDGELSIVTSAMALEAGGVGDTIKVRNSDSGLTISGTIQPDGSVSVSDS